MSKLTKNAKVIGTFLPFTALFTNPKADIFNNAELFLYWLSKTKQTAWQMLPLHETHLLLNSKKLHVPSPYKGYGVGLNPAFLQNKENNISLEKQSFFNEHVFWLDEYALFCSLRDFFGTDNWSRWPDRIRIRQPEAMESFAKKLSSKIEEQKLLQYKLHMRYKKLHDKAKQLGISFIGDMSFYLPFQSPLVWQYQNVFSLDNMSNMIYVSGVPRSSHAHYGRQLWGHPLYKWNDTKIQKEIISIWKLRLFYLSKFYDFVRIDHAKGFFEYGALDKENETNDVYKKGPGFYFLKTLYEYSQSISLPIFLEDSSEDMAAILQAEKKLGLKGIRIFRYGYDEKLHKAFSFYADIAQYPENSVAYTTTHDTESLIGYLELLSVFQKKLLAKNAHIQYRNKDTEFATEIRNRILNSKSQIVIIPIQDWLLTKDRINIPGTEAESDDKNWKFVLPVPIEKLPVFHTFSPNLLP